MDNWNYRIEEVNDRGARVELVLQSNDFSAAMAAYDSLVKTRPKVRLMFMHRWRIVSDSREKRRAVAGDEIQDEIFEMCGRYAITSSPETIRQVFGIASTPINFGPRYNAPPCVDLPVIRYNPKAEIRSLNLLRWGFVPPGAADTKRASEVINAACEFIGRDKVFGPAVAAQRCIVPINAYYEWKKLADGPKMPYAIGMKDKSLMGIAGLWTAWKQPDGQFLRTFAVITTKANSISRDIHRRMPAILPPTTWPAWLGETPASVPQLIGLLAPYPSDAMEAWMVGREIGNVRNDHAGLLEPLA